MDTSKKEQDDDASMKDVGGDILVGSIDFAHRAHDEAMDLPTATSSNNDLEDNGRDARSGPANELTIGEQSNATHKSINPVTEVENIDMDIWDGTVGEDQEQPTPEDLITRLQDENLALKHQIAILKSHVEILKGEKTATARELRTIITNQHGALDNANNRITAAHNRNLGKQHQLDSLYATLTRQERQLNPLYAQLAQQEQHIIAQAAHINTINDLHDKQLRRIRLEVSKMVRSTEQRLERHASSARRFGGEMDRLIINVEDPEVTESEDEAAADEGGERQEVEVIDLIDEDDDDEAQLADGVQSTAIEQPVEVQQLDYEE
ncbi:hypothetical protein M436DRAFT_66391 [Aureobasidium namibiae CBS 147.97]|uniref:Uncharacterized protein n=1 Tax=Aureobasidium namibiae CBS 147.97 TaxID=1043004 RepID=A0A074WBZ9_9PEZI|nr:uncharacterized protein M436DRAFT_66391 [Aureobasidium namibiae CBS 147.97]KEQ70483.1 hypothetical protein M436DRAFT_66391 [Aureobasidium namibiae CBS 147.97]